MAKTKFFNLGTMMLAKKKDPSNEEEPKRFYIKLEQQKDKDKKPYGEKIFPITLANGVVLNDGDILAMFSKKAKFKQLVEEGKMTQSKADDLSSFLLYEIVAIEEAKEEQDPNMDPSFNSSDDIPF